jgi:hypothetical protein
MKKINSSWGQVRDKYTAVEIKGVAYSVDDERDGWLRLRRLEDNHFMPGVRRPDDEAPVVVLEPTHEEAVRLVAERLNGQWLAHQSPGRVWLVDHFPSDETNKGIEAARRHLWVGHGWADHSQKSYSIEELAKIHDDAHAQPDDKIGRPHTHGDLFKRLEETNG